MNRTKISVIVPAYNVSKYLSKCLDSLINQTHKNMEIIVIDDGSVDDTRDIIYEYSKRYKNIIPIYQSNQGVTNARLNGIKKSTGDWIGFVDGDDEIEIDMYEILINNALEYNADISHCGYQMIFSDGRTHYFHNTGSLICQDKEKGMKDLLEGILVEPGLWNKIFRKNLFQDILYSNVMNRDVKINEDLLMNYILFSKANISIFQDVCKYHYMIRSVSATRGQLNLNKIYDPIKVKQLICDMQISGLETESMRAYLRTCVNIYNSILLDDSRKFRQEEIKVRNLIKNNKSKICLLSKKQRLLAILIIYIPWIYPYIYGVYTKYFLNSQYT